MAAIAVLIPLFASADDSGTCGKNVTWYFEESTGTLTISGSGEMYYYYDSIYSRPWEIFKNAIKSVVISDGVTVIGSEAFSGCSNLTSVTIPNSVTGIGSYAFTNCSGLTSVVIPNSVTGIGYWAFSGCWSLKSVTIPNSVTYINEQAFSGCSNLTSVTIPNSVKEISLFAFSGCGLTSVTIPNSVTYIDLGAFSGCSKMTEVNFNATNCTNMGIAIKPVFENCTSLTTLNIGDNVQKIPAYAFWECIHLTNVFCAAECPPSVDETSFSFANIADRCTLHVKDYAIESFKSTEPWCNFKSIVCDELETDFKLTYYVDGELYKEYAYKYGDVIDPEQYPEKEEYTFSGWNGLPETMPGKDIRVDGTFSPTQVTIDGITYQITNGEAIIIGCSKTSGDLTILSSVEDRGHQYPVKTIPSDIFNGKAFTSLTIQNGIETIEAKAFYGCSSIVSVILPSTTTSIGERAFANFDNLETFTCKATTIPNTHRTAFENSYTADYVELYVPQESVETYRTTAPWKDFKSVNGMVITKYTLTYLVDNEPYKTYQLEENDPITPEPAPTRDGYTFSGWSEIPVTMPASDVTITGTFTKLKCATPTIALTSGKMVFSCDTPDVEYHYSISAGGASSGIGNNIPISSTYTVTVYTTRENYDDSDTATMELQLSHGDLNGDGSLSISDAVGLVQMILNKTE